MLLLDGRSVSFRKMDKMGNDGASGGGGGTGDKSPSPGDKGDNTPGGDGQSGDDGENGDASDDESKWTPEQTKSYIKKLRSENAGYRKKAQASDTKVSALEDRFSKLEGGLKKLAGDDSEDDSDSVEAKLARLEQREVDRQEIEAIDDMNRAVEQTALALSVPAEGLDYFRFLIQQEAEQMNDDDAISEEVLGKIAQKVISQTKGSSKGITTSADGEGKKPDPQGKPSGITAAQFAKMTVAEKSALYQNNQDEYSQLMTECKEQRLLFT